MTDTRTLDDRARSAEIRGWAREQGFEVSPRGAIPKGVVAAFDAANGGGGGPDGDGPDWAAAAAVAGDVADPLADSEGEFDGLGEVPPDTPTTAPPPADLDEARERLGGKPRTPGWAKDDSSEGKRDRRKSQPQARVTKQVIGDIEGKLTLLLTGPGLMWQTVDPVCGTAFADNLDSIVRKAVPLIIQSPDAVRWFTKGATFLLWLDLVWALQPVAQAVYAHHVAATVMVLPDGTVVPAQRLDDGRIVPLGAVPQQARPDRSAYTTQVAGHVPPVPA